MPAKLGIYASGSPPGRRHHRLQLTDSGTAETSGEEAARLAKTIATIGGVALKPGVSRNRRLYTAPMLARAVARAQERLKSGGDPMVMLTHHGTGDDSRAISASLRAWSLDEDGNVRYGAGITDTPAGRDIAALADTADGEPPAPGRRLDPRLLARQGAQDPRPGRGAGRDR